MFLEIGRGLTPATKGALLLLAVRRGASKNSGRTRWGVSGGRGDGSEGVQPVKNAAELRK